MKLSEITISNGSIILRAFAKNHKDILQSAVTDGGRRIAPLALRSYCLCKAAERLCRGKYITGGSLMIVKRLFAGIVSVLFLVFSLFPVNAVTSGTDAGTTVSEQIGLVCSLFGINGASQADHAALQWDTTLNASSYILYRSTDAQTGFMPIYSGRGNSYEDDDLQIGTEYYYQLCVNTKDGKQYSGVKSLTPCKIPDGLSIYDNQKGSSLVYETSGTKVGDTYYNYALRSHPGQNDIYLAETTSADGVHFGSERTVADSSQNDALASCKIESIHIEYAEKANKIIVWAHWEKPSGYSDGKALVITGTPGGTFNVHHVYNPLNIQVRDMAVFFDDDADQTGYLIAAANKEGEGANATLYIFRMNKEYSDVTEITNILFKDQYREFPNLIKRNGYYFLFTSQAAGWYPSSGAYSVATDIAGKWSELRAIGNTSTFSSQSGWIVNLQDRNYLMHAYRWLRGSKTSGTTLCPLYFDHGFAFYDYYPSFRYSTKTGDLYPMQEGILLSQDHPASASLGAESPNEPSKAFDGSYQTAFAAISEAKKWPFDLIVDLEQVCDLANIQTSWYICKGSEGYYTYTVEGSTDGEHWTKLLDRTDKSDDSISKTYGFNSDMLTGTARYVKLHVTNATLQNNPNNNWYTPTVYECKVYGKPVGEAETPKPVADYDFSDVSGSTVTDISGNGNALILHGNVKAENGVLHLAGDADDYAALPSGLLDKCAAYTIQLTTRSDSDGDFFTFAVGKDDQKYAFFKIAKDHFRFQVTTDTWRGESGMRVDDVTGTEWHTYTIVVNGSTLQFYTDGILCGETTELTSSLTDMGSGQNVLLGKSFYLDDVGYLGDVSHLTVYRTALTAAEINADRSVALLGDLNGDGAVTAADAKLLAAYLSSEGTLNADAAQAADLSGDGVLNAVDLSILKHTILPA